MLKDLTKEDLVENSGSSKNVDETIPLITEAKVSDLAEL